jgi:hypothetical protein
MRSAAMSYRRIASLHLEEAQYSERLERNCKLPWGAWSVGTGEALLYQLTVHHGAMLQSDPLAILRYRAIAYLLTKVDAACVTPHCRKEIEKMLKKARSRAGGYEQLVRADAALVPSMKQARGNIAAGLLHMRTTGG